MNSSQVAPIPQIKDLELGETIGQGAFAFVKTASLKMDPRTIVAVKFIHLPTSRSHGMSDDDIMKEVLIHSKCSHHRNVLRVIDCNIAKEYLWIAMEMADGGDLFDKIEPNMGVDSEVAQFYYQQLVRAISYLHEECSVAHRDIKPENILLDRDGNLKLADFGLATQFKRKDGTKRVARDQRGSPPYMAPEIIYSNGYFADLTDIWSIGILTFVLLTGETPWNVPSEEDSYYDEFLAGGGNLNHGPWIKINLVELSLLRKILQPNPTKRATLLQLRQHPWFKTQVRFSDVNGMCNDPQLLARKLLSNLKVSLSDDEYAKSTQDPLFPNQKRIIMATQPVENELAHLVHDSVHANGTVFSQHHGSGLSACNDLLMSQFTPDVSKGLAILQFQVNVDSKVSHNFNPNKFTKFFSSEDIATILKQIEFALRQVGIPVKSDLYKSFRELEKVMDPKSVFPVSIDIKTRDRKGWVLSGSVCILEVDDTLKVIGFERKTGDPLEWRSLFKKITILCRDIVCTE
ncbi:serine/threonine protein kinase CHK1 Ecym_6307 [Eremothecium cymbalariae DBVPG|uniref:non-specific serine/threonine protein kinase n=1 Tax=Eremothecium cymbalariae (strain CBS 270.75 / DBVPG 7215 / KCTC 17166 / NRRL Y-17582) TaxID=931890 RepID=G8JUA7_ERECY|nr:hypothetical protein Ecym_6307 [Eremothecium cymbalariae DBVPG\